MRKTTLVVMAAGIGSRFGGGIKQLEPVGPSGEIIMDYSIHDALEAGFNKVVFIIRKDLEKDFREIIGNRMEKLVETAYAFQEIDDLPAGFTKPADRTKPWGTGQAILSCKDLVKEPFAVINADDYYGKEAFVKVHDYLVEEHPASDKLDFCMAGFLLENTLSENGGVTRGICSVNEQGHLTKVTETKNIEKTAEGASVLEAEKKNKEFVKTELSVQKKDAMEAAEFEEKELHLSVIAQEGCDIRASVFYYCADSNLVLLEMKTNTKTLEDVFLELTRSEEVHKA